MHSDSPPADLPAPVSVVPASARPLVSLENIWRSWGRGSRRRLVLRGLHLELMPGSAVCISGRNGTGKTTLLRIAAGILAPDRGSATIDGISAERSWREFHRRIGFLSAGDRGLYVRLSPRAHLEYWTALSFVPLRQRRAVVENALLQFGLMEFADRRADRLSQGQRQRLRLALTVAHRPKVLLLDEPRSSLDEEGGALLAMAVDGVIGSGGCVIWCAPLGEPQPMSFDWSAVLENGQLVEL